MKMKANLICCAILLLIFSKCSGENIPLKEVSSDLLDDLYCIISSEPYQTEPEKFNQLSQMAAKKFSGRDTLSGIKDLMSKIGLNLTFENSVNSIDDERIQEFNDMFEVAVSKQEITCENHNKLIIKGHFVKFSQVIENEKKCSQVLKFVEFYAADTIFIDLDINFSRYEALQIIIVAPTWFIRHRKYKAGTMWLEGANWPLNQTYEYENVANTGSCDALKDPYRYPREYDFPLINRGNFFGVAENLHYGSLLVKNFGPISFFGLNQDFSCTVRDRRIDWGLQKICMKNSNHIEKCVKHKCGQIQGPINKEIIIRNMREFMKETIEKHPILRVDATGFLIKLIGTFDSESMENIFDLVQILKKNHVAFEDRMELLYLYKELSRAIEKKACPAKSIEALKVLYHLNIAILDKISTLEDTPFSNYITNLKEFSDYIVTSMNEITATGDKVLVDRYKTDYVKELDAKINESNSLVLEHIVPTIKSITKDLENQMDDLLNEIKELQKEAEKNREILKMKKAELERIMRARFALGILNFMGTAISFLGPVGAVVGTTLKIGSKVAETTLEDVDLKKPDLPQIYTEQLSKNALRISSEIKTGVDMCEKKKPRHKRMDDEDKKEDNVGKYTEIAEELADVGIDIYKKYKEDKGKIEIIDEQIEMVEKYIEQVKMIKNDFCTSMKPILTHISTELKNLHHNLTHKSVPQLNIVAWQVSSTLKQVKNYLNVVYTGFKVSKKIQFSIEELSDAVITMINIYKGMEKYKQEQRLIEYVANVNSNKFADVVVKDKDLSQRFYETLLYLKSSLIFKEYRRYIDAIKQYSFPLANIYLKTLAIPFKYEFTKTYEESVKDAIDSIRRFRYKIWESTTTINKYDDLKYSSVYFGRNDTNGPFFTWKNEDSKLEIGKLLNGEEVLLKSDLHLSGHGYNAIKFNVINLRFRVKPFGVSFTQEDLDKALEEFQITMKHMGNSYYKCNGKTYIISTDSQNISYSFKKNLEGIPSIRNQVYDKIRLGDYVLSPFASWKMQISLLGHKSKGDATVKFENLKRFINHIDLSLVGRGQYYQQSSELCTHNMEEHYEEENAGSTTPYVKQCPKYRDYYDYTGTVQSFYNKW